MRGKPPSVSLHGTAHRQAGRRWVRRFALSCPTDIHFCCLSVGGAPFLGGVSFARRPHGAERQTPGCGSGQLRGLWGMPNPVRAAVGAFGSGSRAAPRLEGKARGHFAQSPLRGGSSCVALVGVVLGRWGVLGFQCFLPKPRSHPSRQLCSELRAVTCRKLVRGSHG